MKPRNLRCEYLASPLLAPASSPRLSWLPSCDQAAWQVVVARDGETVWDSGRVASDRTIGIEYRGEPLQPLAHYTWKVRVWTADDTCSDWSAPATWITGPAHPGWTWEPNGEVGRRDGLIVAHWIGTPLDANWREDTPPPCPLLRRDFAVTGDVRRATLYASALGLYEARLNGEQVGDHVLAPEWTNYHRKVQYQAYDVTALLRNRENTLAAILAPGWYAGRIGMAEQFANVSRGVYGRRLALIARLEIELADGTRQTVTSNGDWRGTTDGPTRGADLLDGETYDARRERPGWDRPGFDDAAWQPAVCLKGPALVPQSNEPIRITQKLPAQAVMEPAPGVYVVDFGQNLVGWCRLRVKETPAGQEIVLRHAEVLHDNGSVYLDNMRGARPVDRYICRGDTAGETFEPRFTYHGFRYVEIAGLPCKPEPADIAACVLHSAAPETGAFECSDDLVNRIVEAIRWTQRGNLHSTPTDCPQRDERLGWMGDAQVFAQTAIFNMDMAAFFTKWTADIRDAQADDGRFPDFAPHPYNPNQRFSGNPGWADAGVMVPWNLYVNYGDERILADQFDAARRYLDWCQTNNPSLIWRNQDQLSPLFYGDWLNADTFANLPNIPKTGGEVPKELYATAFFARSSELVARMATVLGKDVAAGELAELAERIRAAFNDTFVDTDGRLQGDTQAGYALALNFDLLPEALRPAAARHMVAALEPYGGAPSTGIQTTVRLMLELSRWGYHDQAYAILLRRDMPSWGYMVEHGGTTIWERWDGWVEGRGFQNPGMNSFNHYAIGAVGEWIYRVIGGLNPDEEAPGWKHFFVRPTPPARRSLGNRGGGGLPRATTTYRSIRGDIRSAWCIEDGQFTLKVTVPANTTATVEMPDGTVHKDVAAGCHNFLCNSGSLASGMDGPHGWPRDSTRHPERN